jgi:hypothetical protein
VKDGSFDAYRRLAVALFPRSGDTWLKGHNDGTVDALGLVTLAPRLPPARSSRWISATRPGR